MSYTRMPDGRYRVRVYRAKGKLIDRIVQTENDAKQLEASLRTQVKKGEYVKPSRLTVEAFLHDWLEKSVRRKNSIKTYEQYRSMVKKHIVPVLGSVKLERLEPIHIEDLLARKQGELAPNTCALLYTRLHTALNTAVKWGLVARNVCDAVDSPRLREVDMYILSGREARQVEEAAAGIRMGSAVSVALHTGLRLGEMLGLRWSDIEEKSLWVRRTLRKYGRDPVFGPPKNKKVRSVPLDEEAMRLLGERKVEQELERTFYGDSYRDTGHVFTQLNGGVMEPNYFRDNVWAPVRRRVGLSDKVRFHDLRHTFVSRALAAGANPRAVCDIVGHRDPGYTLRKYAHSLPDDRRAAVEKLNDYLRGGEE